MRILLLNQAFYPDVVASAQYAADLTRALVERGHDVTVLCSARAYDEPGQRFAAHEIWNGVDIIRVAGTGFGKGKKWKRVADFASFFMLCAARAATLPKFDLVIVMTSPPLISTIGGLLSRWNASRLVYWTLDLNPDEAIAAGYLRAESNAARMLQIVQRFSLRASDAIVVLDEFMQRRVINQGANVERVHVVPPWARDQEVRFDRNAREEFRRYHGLSGKFVVMYAGNHSPCHPVDTLLQVAKTLSMRDDIAFVFVGGGSEHERVSRYATSNHLKNVLCLAYHPREKLAGLLSAGDLHVVLMGDAFVGIVHPCKIYNIVAVGAPFLYIGPEESHIMSMMSSLPTDECAYSVRHGDVESAIDAVLSAQRCATRVPLPAQQFSAEVLVPKMVEIIEQAGERCDTADAKAAIVKCDTISEL